MDIRKEIVYKLNVNRKKVLIYNKTPNTIKTEDKYALFKNKFKSLLISEGSFSSLSFVAQRKYSCQIKTNKLNVFFSYHISYFLFLNIQLLSTDLKKRRGIQLDCIFVMCLLRHL